MQILRLKILFFVLLMGVLITASTVHAHRLIVELVEEGLVRVGYEDGRFARRTEVIVYDENGLELKRGNLDQNGFFAFDPEKAALVIADDGLGHRSELRLTEEAKRKRELPRGWTVAGVLVGFFLVAGIFQYRKNRRKN